MDSTEEWEATGSWWSPFNAIFMVFSMYDCFDKNSCSNTQPSQKNRDRTAKTSVRTEKTISVSDTETKSRKYTPVSDR